MIVKKVASPRRKLPRINSGAIYFNQIELGSESEPVCVIEDAARAGKSFPGFAMALGTQLRRRYRPFGLKPARPALNLENNGTSLCCWERIIACKMTVRTESFHADGHV